MIPCHKFNTMSKSPTWVCLVGPPYVSYSGPTQPNPTQNFWQWQHGHIQKRPQPTTNHRHGGGRLAGACWGTRHSREDWQRRCSHVFEWRNEKDRRNDRDHPHSCDVHRSRSQVEMAGYLLRPWEDVPYTTITTRKRTETNYQLGWCPSCRPWPSRNQCGNKPKRRRRFMWHLLTVLVQRCSTNGSLVVWISGIPLWYGLLLGRAPLESQTTGPQTTNVPLVEMLSIKSNICDLLFHIQLRSFVLTSWGSTIFTEDSSAPYIWYLTIRPHWFS